MEPRRAQPPSEKDHGPHTLRVWPGTVVGLFGDDVFVELGPRMQGVISRRQFQAAPAVGDVFEFTLRGQEEGLWVLSLRESRAISTWENMEAGSLVHARVIRVAPGGLELKIGPLHAFMPKSQTGLARDQSPAPLVGKTLAVEVIEVDRERQRVLVSRKIVLQRERESERDRQLGSLQPGQVVQARVTRIESYGVFVAFGRGMEGLVHVSNLAHERIGHPAELIALGQHLELKVLSIKRSGKRIALGLKQMSASPWAELEKQHYIDQIVEGRVTRVTDYGAFVAIHPGVEGLLHNSQTGMLEENHRRALLAPGQRLSVRIQELDCERERLSLSLLHKSGSPIAPDEALMRQSFDELARQSSSVELHSKLGHILARALERGAQSA